MARRRRLAGQFNVIELAAPDGVPAAPAHAARRRPSSLHSRAKKHLGLTGRLTIVPLGLDQIALVSKNVGLVRERDDVIGMVAAQRALDAVGVGVGKLLGFGKLFEFPEDPAQEVNGPKRVGVLGRQYAPPIVDVLPEHGCGEVGLAEMPENRAQAFGRLRA